MTCAGEELFLADISARRFEGRKREASDLHIYISLRCGINFRVRRFLLVDFIGVFKLCHFLNLY